MAEKRTETTWSQSFKKFPQLAEDLETDVLIVGAGMAGMLAAYTLARAGKRVVVLESERVGTGATELTTAFITASVDTEFRELVKMYGKNAAKLVWQSHTEAINYLEHIVKEEKIECEFKRVDGVVFASTEKEYVKLRDEAAVLGKLGARVKLSQAPHPDLENAGFMSMSDQAKFHPIKFLQGLTRAAVSLGAQVYERSEVTSLKKVQKLDKEYIAEVNNSEVRARDVIVATYLPFNAQPKLKFKKGKYISYVLELSVPTGSVAEGIYEDSENPYHYFRVDTGVTRGRDRIIVGGEDHRHEIKINPKKNFAALGEHVRKIWPGLSYKVVRKWRGPIIESSDGLAYIGKVKEHQYVATGFSGNGMTYSAISALLLTDMITDKNKARVRAWGRLYDPARIPSLKQLAYKGRDYVGTLVGGAAKNMFRK